MMMSLSSAAFFAEHFAGTVSVFPGAPGTAKAPLTSTAFAGGLAFGGGCCWAAARPMLPTNASASALVRTRSHRMVSPFPPPATGYSPPFHGCEHFRLYNSKFKDLLRRKNRRLRNWQSRPTVPMKANAWRPSSRICSKGLALDLNLFSAVRLDRAPSPKIPDQGSGVISHKNGGQAV